MRYASNFLKAILASRNFVHEVHLLYEPGNILPYVGKLTKEKSFVTVCADQVGVRTLEVH
jgi:hypothetical protein